MSPEIRDQIIEAPANSFEQDIDLNYFSPALDKQLESADRIGSHQEGCQCPECKMTQQEADLFAESLFEDFGLSEESSISDKVASTTLNKQEADRSADELMSKLDGSLAARVEHTGGHKEGCQCPECKMTQQEADLFAESLFTDVPGVADKPAVIEAPSASKSQNEATMEAKQLMEEAGSPEVVSPQEASINTAQATQDSDAERTLAQAEFEAEATNDMIRQMAESEEDHSDTEKFTAEEFKIVSKEPDSSNDNLGQRLLESDVVGRDAEPSQVYPGNDTESPLSRDNSPHDQQVQAINELTGDILEEKIEPTIISNLREEVVEGRGVEQFEALEVNEQIEEAETTVAPISMDRLLSELWPDPVQDKARPIVSTGAEAEEQSIAGAQTVSYVQAIGEQEGVQSGHDLIGDYNEQIPFQPFTKTYFAEGIVTQKTLGFIEGDPNESEQDGEIQQVIPQSENFTTDTEQAQLTRAYNNSLDEATGQAMPWAEAPKVVSEQNEAGLDISESTEMIGATLEGLLYNALDSEKLTRANQILEEIQTIIAKSETTSPYEKKFVGKSIEAQIANLAKVLDMDLAHLKQLLNLDIESHHLSQSLIEAIEAIQKRMTTEFNKEFINQTSGLSNGFADGLIASIGKIMLQMLNQERYVLTAS